MKRRHILLPIGLAICAFSGFFFIQFHEWLPWIWIGAALLSFGSILAILLGEETWKRKLLWLVVVAGMVSVAHFTRDIQSDTSCRMYLAANKESLSKILSAVNQVDEDFHFGLYAYHKDTSSSVNADSLSHWLSGVHAINVSKARDYAGKSYVYIELWGFLDARFGLIYREEPVAEDDYRPLQHISGNWYR
jgi:hypothetical protein